MPTFKNILCPVDFSPTSRRALAVATELAVSSHAQLLVVHVWQIALYGGLELGTAGDVMQAMSDDAEKLLAEWHGFAKADGAIGARAKMLTGVPWDEVVKLAAQPPGHDLIVMGTHGRSGLLHALLGSVAERVVRHAGCAVLVVR